MALLQSDLPSVQRHAASEIGKLILEAQRSTRSNFGRADFVAALPLLVALLRSDRPDVQQPVAVILQNSAVMIQKNKDVVAAGAVSPLVALLQSDKPDVQNRAACALSNLAAGFSQQHMNAIVTTGAVLRLTQLLRPDQRTT